jgi:hypothetical protein
MGALWVLNSLPRGCRATPPANGPQHGPPPPQWAVGATDATAGRLRVHMGVRPGAAADAASMAAARGAQAGDTLPGVTSPAHRAYFTGSTTSAGAAPGRGTAVCDSAHARLAHSDDYNDDDDDDPDTRARDATAKVASDSDDSSERQTSPRGRQMCPPAGDDRRTKTPARSDE